MAEPTGDAHNLLPDDLLPSLPRLYATEQVNDPVVHLKWFTPDSSWTWYVLEYGPDEWTRRWLGTRVWLFLPR